MDLKPLFKPINPSKALSRSMEFLNKEIPHKNWFISGSVANTRIKDPGDIDVFFLTEQDYIAAHAALSALTSIYQYQDTLTPNAATFNTSRVHLPVQLIKKTFGTTEEVFNSFDINACKKAILPDGTRIQHVTANSIPQVVKPGAATFKRYFNYIDRLNLLSHRYVLGKEAIDKYIEDSTIVDCYYGNQKLQITVNKELFIAAEECKELRAYLYEQAQERAPELLI